MNNENKFLEYNNVRRDHQLFSKTIRQTLISKPNRRQAYEKPNCFFPVNASRANSFRTNVRRTISTNKVYGRNARAADPPRCCVRRSRRRAKVGIGLESLTRRYLRCPAERGYRAKITDEKTIIRRGHATDKQRLDRLREPTDGTHSS